MFSSVLNRLDLYFIMCFGILSTLLCWLWLCEENRLLEKCRHRREDNFETDIKERLRGGVN